jgi:hypothetical protein
MHDKKCIAVFVLLCSAVVVAILLVATATCTSGVLVSFSREGSEVCIVHYSEPRTSVKKHIRTSVQHAGDWSWGRVAAASDVAKDSCHHHYHVQ